MTQAFSYRDPENAAFKFEGGWFRIAAPSSVAALQVLRRSDLYSRLSAQGSLVRFDQLEDSALAEQVLKAYSVEAHRDPVPGSQVFRVEPIAVITYPWEWPNSLLAQAAQLTLDLRRELLEIGLDLKDASAFNVQFRGMRPVFIDVGSIERWRPNPSWNAARQFIEHFVNPLAVGSGGHITAADAWELGRRRGLRSDVARDALPKKQRRRMSLWLLQASTRPIEKNRPAETKYAADSKHDPSLALRATQGLTRKLGKQVRELSGTSHASTWKDYGSRDHYATDDLRRKAHLSQAFVAAESGRANLVLDVGGNDGFTGIDLARNVGANVIVMDADAGALDVLNAGVDISQDWSGKVTPILGDITNLSPGSGVLDAEFAAFTDRVQPTAVICQAVLHHVVITQGVPLPLAVAALARFGAPLQIEFATETDPKVVQLLSQIPNWTGTYSTRALVEALSAHYELVEEVGGTSSTRVVVNAERVRRINA